MKGERKTILWLVSWYPNKYDWFDGDFIQRHAKAAALYDNIHVLFVKQSAGQEEEEHMLHHESGLTEQIIYLPKKVGLPGRVQSLLRWRQVSRLAAEKIISEIKPVIVHVHVPWKAGLLAVWVKKKFGIPYVVTEHWGIYNRVVTDNIYTRSFLFRLLLKRVYQEANSIASVSRFLAEGINQALVKKSYTIIPNAVDTTLFFPVKEKVERFTFLHVSNMVPLKNVEGILAAFQEFLAVSKSAAQLVLVGNKNGHYEQLARQMGFVGDTVLFRGEVPYTEVARAMQHAHVLVLNSDMENSPCVIGEALCCGLPVIATAVGGIPELVSAQNSLLVAPRNNAAMAGAFQAMYAAYGGFDTGQIAQAALQKFSYAAIGRLLGNLYR